ncbi:hypothetical protein GCM10010467_02940 [Actinocorallia glomerata]|uniref:Uncharacterized protein n=2 Tax=Actinomycetes TaxID=1760 RepID=A0ABP6M6Y3_9MICC
MKAAENLGRFDHDPVRDAWVVTSQRMRIDVFGNQRSELVPQGFDDRRWQGRHEHLGEEKAA